MANKSKSVVVDLSKYFAETNEYPPLFGSYLFRYGDLERSISLVSFKSACITIRKQAKRRGIFTAVLLEAKHLS